MPSSRKRAQGKARKENAGAATRFPSCRHGSPSLVPGQLSCDFIGAFQREWNELVREGSTKAVDPTEFSQTVGRVVERLKAKYPTLTADHPQRQMVRAHILAAAANAIVTVSDESMGLALTMAAVSLTCVEVDEEPTFGMGQPIMLCSERDLVKYLRQRIPCQCLDARWKQLRECPSVAPCSHCGQIKERKMLLLCSRCKCDNYCSRDCQVAAWSGHKKSCKARSFAQTKSVENGVGKYCGVRHLA